MFFMMNTIDEISQKVCEKEKAVTKLNRNCLIMK